MRFHFEDKLLDDLLDKIANGRSCLFLGAGFSASGKTKDGFDIPIGVKIGEKLISYAKLTVARSRPLTKIYDAAIQKTSRHDVNDFLKHQYSGCQSTWQQIIPSFLWKRIYTTNIDDLLNNAMNKCTKPIQSFVYKNYRDRFESVTRDLNETQVVNLHGSVRKSSAGFIFGAKEYASAVKENLSWHLKYSEDYAEGSFIFVGSQLIESDLDIYTSYREEMGYRDSQRPNSFLVTPEVDDVVINSMKSNGILCIESTAEEFFQWLDSKIPTRIRKTDIFEKQTPRIATYTSEISKQAYIKFRNQFHKIEVEETFSRPDFELHDFFAGDPPEWWDIKNNNDAILRVVDSCTDAIKRKKDIVLVLSGSAGCGKTTTLKRIAYIMAEDNWQVYYYEDEGLIDVESAKHVIKSTKGSPILIVVDNAADYIDKIDILIKELGLLSPNNKLNVKILTAERDNRLARVFAGLRTCHPIIEEVDAINRGDIKLLLNKLTEKDKLRKLRDLDEGEQISFFEQYADNQLLVAMKELTYDGKFDNIISDEYNRLDTDIARSIYAAVALCHSQRHSISIDVLHRALNDKINYYDLVNIVNDGNLKKIVINSKGRLNTRHTLIAQHLLKSSKLSTSLNRRLKADLMIRIMKALAPLVNITQLSKGTPEALLVKNFMDYDHIENIFGEDSVSIERFFTELKTHYDWNSKYWAQRGLFESKRKNFSDAIDFVDYAVKRDDHWTIRNAQGLVYLRASSSSWVNDISSAKSTFNRGVDILESVLAENLFKERKAFMTILLMSKSFAIQWNTAKEARIIFDKFNDLAIKSGMLTPNDLKTTNKIKADLIKLQLGLNHNIE
jgi:tetratricopeptide (TPR) repeat protein